MFPDFSAQSAHVVYIGAVAVVDSTRSSMMHLPLKKNTYISQQFGFFLCQNACRSICIVLFYICFVFENQCVYSIYIHISWTWTRLRSARTRQQKEIATEKRFDGRNKKGHIYINRIAHPHASIAEPDT